MNCTVARRQAIQRAADAIRDCQATVAVDVLDPSESPRDRWTCEVIVAGDHVPPAILTELALEGLSLYQQPPQGDHQVVVATA